MCSYYDGDLDTPYCTNRRDNGGVINHGLNQWWLPCALGKPLFCNTHTPTPYTLALRDAVF